MIHSKMHGRYLGIFIITYDVDAAQGLGDFGTSPPPALTLKRCLLMVSDQHVWTHILQLNSTETPVQIFEATIQSGKIQVRQSLLNRLCKTTYPPCLSLTSGKTNILGPHISKRAPNFRGDDRFLFLSYLFMLFLAVIIFFVTSVETLGTRVGCHRYTSLSLAR